MAEMQLTTTGNDEDLRGFVETATTEEIIERLIRLEHRLVELDARLRCVRDIVDDAAL
jgi:hypothetical protein